MFYKTPYVDVIEEHQTKWTDYAIKISIGDPNNFYKKILDIYNKENSKNRKDA